ncbi:MAG: ABC transporter substrate-binding protein [Kiritimatiellae bacterium]|nr:ABC transporter substrate-binding protein [Kiritimatiellia bacterium]
MTRYRLLHMLERATPLIGLAVLIGLPFALRRSDGRTAAPGPTAPVALRLAVISPHNDAIRREFARAFSRWHAERHGTPVDVQWIVIGGTTEIARFLETQYTEAVRAWWRRRGRPWRADLAAAMFRATPPTGDPLAEDLWREYRSTDSPAEFGCRLDVFFGGGQYDFHRAATQGMLVPPWPPGSAPSGLFTTEDGTELIPETVGGETLRTDRYFAAAVSAFGIMANLDRCRELGAAPPVRWADLEDPRWFGTLALADPTKSGSVAKAFEMIVHEACRDRVHAAGFTDAQIDAWEEQIRSARRPPGELPPGVPAEYQRAVEDGWRLGVLRLQRLGANSRQFADASSRIPLDVAHGRAAAGLAIDFYARFQEQFSRGPDGGRRVVFHAPPGGTTISGDPVGRLRGAEQPALAARFIEFVLSPEGQRLWAYRVGAPGGPERYALRRMPVRRDFYPSANPVLQNVFEQHRPHTEEDLTAPDRQPYRLAESFTYRPRWTADHFGVLRDLVRAMCVDSHDELCAAWRAILANGGPEAQPRAIAVLERLPDSPEPLNWRSAIAPAVPLRRHERLARWTAWFRSNYRECLSAVVHRPSTAASR